jgi:hypothetical protein
MVLKIRSRPLRVYSALLVAAALALGAAACGDDDNNGASDTTPTTAVAQPTTVETDETPQASTPVVEDIDEDHPAVVAAREKLLESVDVEPADVRLVSAVAKTFSNACLDVQALSATPEVCAQVLTPGYEIVFQIVTTVYTYRTDESATSVRFAGVDVGGGPSEVEVP